MIRIYKSTDEPDISVYKKKNRKGINGDKVTLAQQDLEKSIAHYSDPANYRDNKKLTSKKFTYKAYSHTETKEVLQEIFKSKCAYCESFVAHVAPEDIEHFRPKAAITTQKGDKLVPGYYWLGADWNNLLLSCIKCNRSNNEPINLRDGIVENMGKANHFPLSDETKRIRIHGNENDIVTENNYVEIINPCIEDPNDYLLFKDNGQVKALNSKGEYSIEVYGLFRADLVLRRKKTCKALHKTLVELIKTIQVLEKLMDLGASNDDDAFFLIQSKKERLDTAFHEEAEYLGLKRQKLNRFIDGNPLSYNKLKVYGIDLKEYL